MTRGGTAYSYVYDDNNKLTSASGGGTNAYFYYNPTGTPGNVTGNMLGSWTLWYNEENRLIQVTYPPSGVTDTFTYNWAGLRTRATLAGTTYRYLYNGERVLEELTDAGAMTARYTTENGSYYGELLHLKRATGESRFPLYDAIGDVERLVDGSATVTDSYTLDSFGRQLGGTTPTPNPYRFGGAWGYITDPSGLLQLGARFYWPELGRFLQQDPIGDGVNWYAYADDNPLRYIDPEGASTFVSVPSPIDANNAALGHLLGPPEGVPGGIARAGYKAAKGFGSCMTDCMNPLKMCEDWARDKAIEKGLGLFGRAGKSLGKAFGRVAGEVGVFTIGANLFECLLKCG
jgi:RHS repeat-associated protein